LFVCLFVNTVKARRESPLLKTVKTKWKGYKQRNMIKGVTFIQKRQHGPFKQNREWVEEKHDEATAQRAQA